MIQIKSAAVGYPCCSFNLDHITINNLLSHTISSIPI